MKSLTNISPSSQAEPQDIKPFLVILTLLTLVIAAFGFWKQTSDFLNGQPVASVDVWKASLSKQEAVEKWVRDRASESFGLYIVSETSDEATAKYQERTGSGSFAEITRVFRFNERGSLVSSSLISSTSGKTVRPAMQAAPEVMAPGVAQQAPAASIPASADNFPWGVRAQKAQKAVQEAALAKAAEEVRPVMTVQPQQVTEAPQPQQTLPDDFPWGVRAQKAAQRVETQAVAAPVIANEYPVAVITPVLAASLR